MTQTILVLGALGGVGRAVAEAFRDDGFTVKGFVRPGREPLLPADVTPVSADLFDTASAARAAGAADFVFNGLNAPYQSWATDALPLYEAALKLVRQTQALHLFPGNVYAFGAGMPRDLTPDTPFAPTSEKGRIRLALEQRLRAAAETGEVRTVLLRAGDFFGPGADKSWVNSVIGASLSKGRVMSPGDPGALHAFAYLPDLARAFVALARAHSAADAPYQAFHFPGHAASIRDMAAAGQSLLGKPVSVWRIPGAVFTIMGWFSPVIRAAHEMHYLWTVPHRLVDPRLEAITKTHPARSLPDALRYLMR